MLSNFLLQMFAGYDDNEIGALDTDEIEGPVAPNASLVLQCAEEFGKERQKAALETVRPAGMSVLMESDSESEGEMVGLSVDPRTRERWDCESVLTTRSNLYNHPKVIPAGPGKVSFHYSM